MKQVYEWYAQQTKSSQVLVLVAALLIVYVILFEMIYSPWKTHLANLEAQVNSKIETVSWMNSSVRKYAKQINAIKNASSEGSKSKRSFLSVVERSAKKNKIYSSIERISPDKAGRVKVWINDVNFKAWLTWIEQLKLSDVDVYSVRINQLAANEKVTMLATFQSSK